MEVPDDHYFAERSRRERQAAREASDPRSAAIHIDLAQRYEAVAEALAALDRARMTQA